MPGKTRPIEKFAEAAAKCSMESAAYGVCIASKYQNVQKGMCAKEFKAVMDCYVKVTGRKF